MKRLQQKVLVTEQITNKAAPASWEHVLLPKCGPGSSSTGVGWQRLVCFAVDVSRIGSLHLQRNYFVAVPGHFVIARAVTVLSPASGFGGQERKRKCTREGKLISDKEVHLQRFRRTKKWIYMDSVVVCEEYLALSTLAETDNLLLNLRV